MRILICGKGGCGKSTLSVMLARAFDEKGYRVILVDADESNFGIPHLIGVEPPMDLMESFGGKKAFKQKLNAPFPADGEGVFVKQQPLDALPPECVSRSNGIRVVSIGKIHHFGEGCACPMGMLSKRFLSSLATEPDEVVLVDTEAGVEHFGRGVIAEGDVILVVVDPTAESLKLAGKIRDMAERAEKEAYFVLNKVDADIEPMMVQRLDASRVIARIAMDNQMLLASLDSRPIITAGDAVVGLADRLAAHFGP